MPSPTRSSFDQKLARLDNELMLAAAVVAQSIGAVAEALATANRDLAVEVVVGHANLELALVGRYLENRRPCRGDR